MSAAKQKAPAAVKTPAKEEPAEPEEQEVEEAEPESAEPEATPQASAEPKETGAEQQGATDCSVDAAKNLTLFFDFGARYDLGNFSQVERVGQNEQSQNNEIRAWAPEMHLGLMSRLDRNWRMGGAFGYLFNYDTNNNNGTLMGQLLTLDFRLEWTAPISGKWSVLIAPKFGLSSILPGGDLQDRIDLLQQQGYGTISGPRLGFLVGADTGVRYHLTPWFSIRGTIGYLFSMNFLLNSGASAQGIDGHQTWVTSASRLAFLFGPEVSF